MGVAVVAVPGLPLAAPSTDLDATDVAEGRVGVLCHTDIDLIVDKHPVVPTPTSPFWRCCDTKPAN